MSVSSRVQHAVLPRPAGAPDSAGRDAAGESGRAVCGVHPRCAPARDHGAVVAVRRGGAGRAAPGGDRAWLHRPPRDGATRAAVARSAHRPLERAGFRHAAQHRPRPHDESRESARQVRAPEAEVLARLDHRRAPDIVRAAQQLNLLEAIQGARDTDVQFAHQLFQEFFAARVLAEAGAGAGPSGVAGSGDRAGRRPRCSTRSVGVSVCRSCRRRAGRRRRWWRRR